MFIARSALERLFCFKVWSFYLVWLLVTKCAHIRCYLDNLKTKRLRFLDF